MKKLGLLLFAFCFVASLLVEQNAYKALGIAAKGYILETGHIVKSGPASDLMKDDAVKAAYLGT